MKNCNTNKQYTIRVVENNSFALVMPLKRRTYVSNKPIDEDINASELEDVVLKVGGVEYTPELGDDGVRVVFPDGLPAGTYDIVLTAIYHGSKIMAAYFEALRSVNWNYMSDAQNYLPGSPIVAEAAYIIGGVLTDAELAQLKERYRQAAIAAEEAEAEAIAEKEKYAEAVQELDDLATEPNATRNKQAILDALDAAKAALQGDNTSATLTTILAAFGNIDFSTLAKQGDNPDATNTAILSAIAALVIPTVQQIQAGLAKSSEIPSVASIQNGLAKSSELPTGYALQGTNDNATNTAILAAFDLLKAAIQGTDTTVTLTALMTAIGQISIDPSILEGLATEANATLNKQAILDAIAALIGTTSDMTLTTVYNLVMSLYGTEETTLTNIFDHVSAVLTALAPKATSQDVSTLAAGYTLATLITALNGGDATATLSAIKSAIAAIPTNTASTTDVENAKQALAALITALPTVQQIQNGLAKTSELPTDYAKQSNLGSDDDSAAETGTLFAIVKYIKNTVKSVYTSVGSALASAVAAIKGDTENIISTQAGHTTTLGNINTNMAKNDTVAKEATVNAGFAAGAKEATVNAGTAAIEQKIEGTFVKVDFTEDGLPLTQEGGMCPITDGTDVFAGDYDMYSTHETSYTVGTIIQCTADNEFEGSSNVYAFIKAGASNLGISSSNAVTGTFEFGTWKKGHYYRVAQIIEGTDLNSGTTVHIFTYEELPATIVEGFDQTKEAVQAAKQAIKGSDAAATLTAIYAHLNGGGSLPADVQQQLTLILNYLGSPAAMSCEGMTPQEVVDELEDIFGIMGLDIAPCSVDSEGNVTAPSES